MSAAYLDASALVKLFKREPESQALKAVLDDWPLWVSSEIVAVEASCAAQRLAQPQAVERADRLLERVELIAPSGSILLRARHPFSPALRALGAIHLATALELGDDVGAFFAYDRDLIGAARAAGLRVESPA